jgi:hypothetical protein
MLSCKVAIKRTAKYRMHAIAMLLYVIQNIKLREVAYFSKICCHERLMNQKEVNRRITSTSEFAWSLYRCY